MKYILTIGTRGNEEIREFADADKAIKEGDYIWNHMCEADKKATQYMYVLESINPDEDADNHFDGERIKEWV